MESKILLALLQTSFVCFFAHWLAFAQEIKESTSAPDTYIVHVTNPFEHVSALLDVDLESWYSSFLPKSTGSFNGGSGMLLHSYRHVMSGFAAKLTTDDVEEIAKKDGFISARKQRVHTLHTTHTPSFLGLHQNVGFWEGSNYGEGIVIGLLDSGITPDHPCFSDQGMPYPPSKWKGKCEGGIVCNNKLIGARNLVNTSEPPLDVEGHGTHTSSTAGGNFVSNANVFGQGNGKASGMAPRAHVAMYKVCEDTCTESDILAGMDAAIEDGVDVISYSLGGGSFPFYQDSLTIAAYSAIQKGIIVSASAGNDGPLAGTLSNEAPWVITVGASTLDRNFRTTVVLGNSGEFDGQSVFQPKKFPTTLSPLVYPGSREEVAKYCGQGSLNTFDVKGKVVMCYIGGDIARIDKGRTVKDAGGIAMILLNTELEGYSVIADTHVLPVSHVSYDASQKIVEYFNSTTNPEATISFKGTIIGVKDAPTVTHFSSRGPSLESPGIMKPDIIGPGLSILAAWPVSLENNTNTKSTFNVISGTSMSCPHLSGIAALLRKSHPNWSSAAIKSAIMTTADILNLNNQPIMNERMQVADMFTLGSGHVNPSKANDPGLVYDIHPKDYIPYLCGLDYNDKQVGIVVQQTVNCSQIKSIEEAQLNYPSISIKLASSSKTYTRTVTNVGEAQSTYDLTIYEAPDVDIEVNPAQLVFTSIYQKISYQVTFTRNADSVDIAPYAEGAIAWSDSNSHVVRIPISVQLL